MKQGKLLLCVLFLLPGGLFAQQGSDGRLSAVLTTQTARRLGTNLTKSDAYGTPYVLKLARQGDVKLLRQTAQEVTDGGFLLTKDHYGNNIFHVAKNAATVQVLAGLIRQFYGTKTPQIIRSLVDEKNRLGETALMAQINAGHADTFRPLYEYTTLRIKNNAAKNRLTRLHGSDDNLFEQNQEIYCGEIIRLGSANGRTLLQAAQDQVPYHPQMSNVVQNIRRRIPCLAAM